MQVELKLSLVALIWVTYYFLHSFLASTRFKEAGRSRIGKNYRILYNLWASLSLILASWACLQFEAIMLWQNSVLAKFGSVILMVQATLIGLIALRGYDLGEFSGLGEAEEKDVPLRTKGLNAMVRHPLYTAIFWFLLGLGIYHPTDTLWVTIGVSIGYLYWGSWLEEKKLLQRYGEAYQKYRTQVNRFFPKIL